MRPCRSYGVGDVKLISEDLQSWSLRRQRIDYMSEKRAAGSKRATRGGSPSRNKPGTTKVSRTLPAQLRYYAPRDARRGIEQFFDQVNDLLASGREVRIDFRKCERLYPCGLLILMGWVDDWVSKYPGRITGVYPKDDLVEQMLQHVGVLSKLGLPHRKTVTHDDVVRWHYFHGRNADATPIEPFMLQLQGLLGEELQLGLGNCVTEAMINVGHHAYQGKSGGAWWIFATISKGTVFIALHDRGDSVPGTLLAKPQVTDYLSGRMWSLGRGDGKLITAAVGGRTRTNLPYRGKGLPEMLQFTKSYPRSELGIFSRNGFFRFDGEETTGRLSSSIKGTLIVWMLKIAEATK